MTLEELKLIIPNASAKAGVFHSELESAMLEFDITTPKRQAGFLANVAVESGSLQAVSENLNYKPEAILATFNTPRIVRFTQDQANEFGRTAEHPANQEMIANIAYANRMGNGDVDSGDGWRHRGAGLIQTTFADNQRAVAEHFGIPFAEIGEWLRTPEGAARSAAFFWQSNGINEIADRGDIKLMRKRVNGGKHGLAEVVVVYERALEVLGA